MARFDAVIFDMDGTLVESLLDFGAIRDELGIARDRGILEEIETMGAVRKRRAARYLLSHELRGARSAKLISGACETVRAVGQAGMKTALMTRNARRAMEMILAKFPLRFDLAWAREDGPVKPAPDGVLAACDRLGVSPERTVSIGDFRYDIEAANAAGAVSVLLARNGPRGFDDQADFVISELSELLGILDL